MADNDGQIEDGKSVVETITGSREFRGSVEHRDPTAEPLSQTPRPDHIPEKFWDPIKGEPRLEDLVRSYSELEKKIGAPKDDEPKADDPEDDEPEADEPEADEPKDDEPKDDEPNGDDDAAPLGEALTAAQAVYAETGELPAEAREPFHKAGFSDEQIDLYIAGVKATENALKTTAATLAGSEDDLNAALAWAASEDSGWTDKKRIAFNSQMGDVETIKLALPGLMAEFRAANPGEGSLANINAGISRGDIYESMDDFRKDLDAADKARDRGARKKAVDKLRRSRTAGSIKGKRRSPFGG